MATFKGDLVRFLLAFSIFAISAFSWAQSADACKAATTTHEINACAELTLKAKDKELNAAYQKLLKSLASIDKQDSTDYAGVKKQLIEAQRAWLLYRDNDCKAKLTLYESGTIRTVIYLGCMSERTEQRTKELKAWSDG